MVNRVGDLGLLMGICLLFWAFAQAGHPTLGFRAMAENASALAGLRAAGIG